MKEEIKLEEIKKIELDILVKFDEFCRKENLKYYIFEGTLLGAVKYKGFIPWDDDIDVCMPREDYMILIDKLSKKPIKSLELFSVYNNQEYYYQYAKLINTKTILIEENQRKIQNYGLFIDIFPIDGIQGNEEKVKKYLSKQRTILNFISSIQVIEMRSNSKIKKIIKKIVIPIIKLFGNKPIKRIDRTFINKNDATSEFVTKATNKGEYYRREWFKEQVEIEFEGKKFYAPIDYDKILRVKFGEYEKDPPKEKQVTHHNFTVYRK